MPATLHTRFEKCIADGNPAWAVVEPGERLYYRRSVEAIARSGKQAVDFLIDKLDDPRSFAVWHAGLGLAVARRQATATTRRIVGQLAHPNDVVRLHVRWILRALAPRSVQVLAALWAEGHALRAEIVDALAFMGPAAEPALAVVDDDALVRAVRGPWKKLPAEPVPYLGENMRMDPPARDRDAWERSVWSGLPYDVLVEKPDLLDVASWRSDNKARTHLERWRPGQIVVAMPEITLWYYVDENRYQRLRADDGRAFTMAELLWKALRCAADGGIDPNRIFEGLRHRGGTDVLELRAGS